MFLPIVSLVGIGILSFILGIVVFIAINAISGNWFSPKTAKRLGELMDAQREIYHRINTELSTCGGGTKLWFKIRYGNKAYELFSEKK